MAAITTKGTADSGQQQSRWRRFLSPPRPVRRKVEHYLVLRGIALVLAVWTTLALAWVGAPLWIWAGGALALTVGHIYSWYYRDRPSQLRNLLMGLAVMGVLALAPRTAVDAARGDWLPVAYFILLFQVITSFELPTRRGLYANMTLGGLIFFLASQRALDLVFGVFLMGFTTLLLAFMATSFLVDQAERARVSWFRSEFSSAWFWCSVFVGILVLSTGVFLMMPKGMTDPLSVSHAVFLPLRPADGTFGSDANARFRSIAAALPLDGTFREGFGLDGEGVESLIGSQEGAGFSESDFDDAPLSDLVVMQVRSPVLTYWRGSVFSDFDGQYWSVDPSYTLPRPGHATRVVFRDGRIATSQDDAIYRQTYFIRKPVERDALYTGYAAIVAILPEEEDARRLLSEGSVYNVFSSLPDFGIDRLGSAPPSTLLDQRYHYVDESKASIRELAEAITADVFNDLSRMSRIVHFLNTNYTFDPEAGPSPLDLSRPVEGFLSALDRGNGMDFGTASVLLARAAGIPARLAAGYLPGRFDPLSGTFMVEEEDLHAWAEIYLEGVGWVPFDGAPRPELRAFDGAQSGFESFSSGIMDLSYGDDVFRGLQSVPDQITETLDSVPVWAIIVGVAALGTLAVVLLNMNRSRNGGSGRTTSYSTLEGAGRADTISTYREAQRATMTHGGTQARSLASDVVSHLDWLKRAAWSAAYDPRPFDPATAGEARDRLEVVKGSVRRYGL